MTESVRPSAGEEARAAARAAELKKTKQNQQAAGQQGAQAAGQGQDLLVWKLERRHQGRPDADLPHRAFGDQVELEATARVVKRMVGPPRRIGELELEIAMPRELPHASRAKYEEIARTCPVARSLHPDVHLPIRFAYP